MLMSFWFFALYFVSIHIPSDNARRDQYFKLEIEIVRIDYGVPYLKKKNKWDKQRTKERTERLNHFNMFKF